MATIQKKMKQNTKKQKQREKTSVGKVMEKPVHLYTVDEGVKWYRHCGKQYGGSSKKLKIQFPYGPAIPLLGI